MCDVSYLHCSQAAAGMMCLHCGQLVAFCLTGHRKVARHPLARCKCYLPGLPGRPSRRHLAGRPAFVCRLSRLCPCAACDVHAVVSSMRGVAYGAASVGCRGPAPVPEPHSSALEGCTDHRAPSAASLQHSKGSRLASWRSAPLHLAGEGAHPAFLLVVLLAWQASDI